MTNSVDPVQSATKLTDLKHDCLQRQGGYIRVQQGQALFVPKTIPSSFSLVKTDYEIFFFFFKINCGKKQSV